MSYVRHKFFTFEEGKSSDPKSRLTEKGFCDYITIEEENSHYCCVHSAIAFLLLETKHKK